MRKRNEPVVLDDGKERFRKAGATLVPPNERILAAVCSDGKGPEDRICGRSNVCHTPVGNGHVEPVRSIIFLRAEPYGLGDR